MPITNNTLGSHAAVKIMFVLSALFYCGCSGGSDSSSSVEPSVYISSPDSAGQVVITGTQNVAPGDGLIVGKNISQLNVLRAAVEGDEGCTKDSAVALDDGSFFSLSLCASVGDTIEISFTEGGEEFTVLGTYAVPVATAATCQAGERAFTITNSSSEQIWLGVTAGTISCLSDQDCPTAAAGSCKGANAAASTAGTCGCATSSDCGTIAQCNTDNSFCYWNLPPLSIGQMNLAPSAKSILCFPAPQSGIGIQWSGNMFARTGCDSNGQHCATADCDSAANAPCPTGTGGNPPNTLLEFTLSNQTTAPFGPDFYDVSIINGINLAASFVPSPGTFTATSGDPYSCAGPGSPTQSGTLSGCSWTVTPTVSGVDQTNLLKNVAGSYHTSAMLCPNGGAPNSLGYCECAIDSDCSSAGLVCGLALNAKKNQQYTQVCGTKIGWWSADQICGSSINNVAPFEPFGAPLNCASTITNSDGTSSSYTNLHICTKPADSNNPEQAQSCYNNQAVSDCCGCATSSSADFSNWPSIVSSSFGGADNGCYANNPQWVSIAQPWLVFLKQACPTAYVYPFDDATSTFTCQGSGGASGAPTYEVTFFDTK